MIDSKCQRIRCNLLQLKEIASLLLPKGKSERFLFLFFFVVYFSYSLVFLLYTSIVDDPYMAADIFFSFDNAALFHEARTGVDTHPLLYYYIFPFIKLSSYLTAFHFKLKGVFLVGCTVSLITLANVYIFRYLREIVGLNKFYPHLITLLFGFFSTNMVLCFTTESYTISLFLLSFIVYYYSHCMQKGKTVRLLTLCAFSFAAGGTTVTNVVKSALPYLFTRGSFKQKLINLTIVASLFLLVMLWVDSKYHVIQMMLDRAELYSKVELYRGELYEMVIDLFMGSSILFPQVMEVPFSFEFFYLLPDDPENARRVMILDYYRHWWQYAVIAVFYLSMLWAVVKNYKDRLIYIALSMYLCDLLIHLVVKYGVGEGFIYGGHWVFVVPILIGWMFKSLGERGRKIAAVAFSALLIVLIVNNGVQLHELLIYAQKNYPPIFP